MPSIFTERPGVLARRHRSILAGGSPCCTAPRPVPVSSPGEHRRRACGRRHQRSRPARAAHPARPPGTSLSSGEGHRVIAVPELVVARAEAETPRLRGIERRKKEDFPAERTVATDNAAIPIAAGLMNPAGRCPGRPGQLSSAFTHSQPGSSSSPPNSVGLSIRSNAGPAGGSQAVRTALSTWSTAR